MVNQKLGFITVAISFGYITTLTGLFPLIVQQRLSDSDGNTLDQPRAGQRLVQRLDVGRRVQPSDALAPATSPDVVALVGDE